MPGCKSWLFWIVLLKFHLEKCINWYHNALVVVWFKYSPTLKITTTFVTKVSHLFSALCCWEFSHLKPVYIHFMVHNNTTIYCLLWLNCEDLRSVVLIYSLKQNIYRINFLGTISGYFFENPLNYNSNAFLLASIPYAHIRRQVFAKYSALNNILLKKKKQWIKEGKYIFLSNCFEPFP